MSKKIKVVIVVLVVLLFTVILALAGVLIHNHLTSEGPATVVVPDNLITSDSETSEEETNADTFYLHSMNEGDNTHFAVTNMFPGDAVTKYFCVKVSYHGEITVRYHAEIYGNSEKLAEVLKVKVVLLGSSSETLYDGLMRDMPASLNVPLTSSRTETEELFYEITAYLDTSVGNEYQLQNLAANFEWWVEEANQLAARGHNTLCDIVDWFVVIVLPLDVVLAGVMVILLIVWQKKGGGQSAGGN